MTPFCFYQILLKWKITVIFLALDLRDILFSFTTIYRISSNIRLSFSHNDNHPINIPMSSFFRVDRKKKSYSIQNIICNGFWDLAEHDVMITIKNCWSLHNAASFENYKLIDILWILKTKDTGFESMFLPKSRSRHYSIFTLTQQQSLLISG